MRQRRAGYLSLLNAGYHGVVFLFVFFFFFFFKALESRPLTDCSAKHLAEEISPTGPALAPQSLPGVSGQYEA